MTGKSLAFVIVQLVLFILFALIPAGFAASFWWQFSAFILVVTGVVIASAAILQLGSQLNPLPSPTLSATLLTTGMYKMVRHPVYSGLLLITAGISLYTLNIPRALLTLLLMMLFYYKSKYEEVLLVEKFPSYQEYRKKTGRFFPLVFRKKKAN